MIKYIVNREPMIFGTIYLLLIPFYALIYDNMPRSFYHSTTRFEEKLFFEKQEIISLFEKDFKRYYGILKKRDTIAQDSAVLMLNYCNVDDFWIRNNYGYLLCNFVIAPNNQKFERGKSLEAIPNKTIIKFHLLSGIQIIDKRDSLYRYSIKLATFLNRENTPINRICGFDISSISSVWLDGSLPKINKYKIPIYTDVNENNENEYLAAIERDSNVRNYVISSVLDDKILQYLYTINGFPYGYGKSNFFRMLYFSAITICTVGFGDIVPITDSARLLVASEALFGIILIGLFLNSLASKIGVKN